MKRFVCFQRNLDFLRFDTNMVQIIADEMKFYEFVVFIEEHKGDYAKFILTGEC